MLASDALWHHLRHRPDAVAMRFGDLSLTFGALDQQARAYAAGLRALGVRRGDRVACALTSSPMLVVALLGHYLLGAVHVPVNTRYGRTEVAHILKDSGAVAVLVDAFGRMAGVIEEVGAVPGLKHRIAYGAPQASTLAMETLCEHEPLPEEPMPADEDLAMFIYTSGTTGRSKGVMLPFRAVVSNIDALTKHWRWTEADRLVLALPLFHVHGLCIGVHGMLLRGCTVDLLPRFEADAVIDAMGEGGTIFMGVPTMYSYLVKALDKEPTRAQAMRGARLYTSGSAALSADLFEAFEAHTGHRILERYGMSETLLTVSNPYEPARRKPGTIGFAVSSGEVVVVDEEGQKTPPGQVGEIRMRGQSLMQGYWRAPEKTQAAMKDGWFCTGDAARYDEDGYIVHVGRGSVDILKCGGYKISAREIEEAIARHPLVDEVAVLGVPDDEWGQRIVAALVLLEGGEEVGDWMEELRVFLVDALADYKRPRGVLLLEKLPRNALGKIQKHLIEV